MKKIKYLFLPFLVIFGAISVKAYDFTGIDKVSRVDFGLYQDTTLLTSGLTSCTSSNDGYCGLEDSDLPNSTNTYNNMRIVIRGNLNQSFQTGTQYMISYYFYQYTPGYFVRQGDITQVTGNTYRDFTNWISDNITIISYNLNLLETSSNKGLYRFDVVFIPSSTSIAGFNFRIYQDYESISNNNDCYIEGTRYVSISQLSPGQIDYTQNFNNVINNQNQNTQDIIDNQNQNTQDIIDNQNQNTQDIIDSQMSCTSYDNKNIKIFNHYLSVYGVEISSNLWGITDYLNIKNAEVNILQVFTGTSGVSLCYYGLNKELIRCQNVKDLTVLNIPSNAVFIRVSINNTLNQPIFEICKNGTQAITDSITDNTPPDTNALSNASGWLPAGPVDSILNLPLTLLQSLNNAFSSNSCQPLVIHFPHISTQVPIPCMSTVWQNFGLLPLFTWIGRVIGGILLYKYLISLYKWVDDTLTMRENNNFDDGSLG